MQALEGTVLILISHQDLHQMLVHPLLAFKMEHFGRRIAEHYLCCYEDRMTWFITQTPEERYLKMVETGREIFQRVPQHYIANFLGITPVSLRESGNGCCTTLNFLKPYLLLTIRSTFPPTFDHTKNKRDMPTILGAGGPVANALTTELTSNNHTLRLVNKREIKTTGKNTSCGITGKY